MYQYALFDLDGTLTDPSLGITNSIMYALSKMGRNIPPRESLYCFIGPPLISSFMEFTGMTEAEANTALIFYREYFSEKGLFENVPYDGIADTLAQIKKRGVTMAVATSKPEKFAIQIIDHFGLSEYFEAVCGASLDNTRTQKGDVIRYALNTLSIPQSTRSTSVIMVGDRHHDIEGAAENHLSSLGILWGFGSQSELASAGATYIAHSMGEMIKVICE